tara:strand:+ start:12490 stop:13662 length:1173 start_codon:yes stop_codon:yes gene_type:complete
MNNKLLALENIYKNLIQRAFLRKDTGVDPELLTNLSLSMLGNISARRSLPIYKNILNYLSYELEINDPRLEQILFGCKFTNPIGLAAGFDKNGVASGIWKNFGFGFSEIGTVTYHQQAGNNPPRLFRLSKEKAALNRMGFNNQGAKEIEKILMNQNLPASKNRHSLIGINLGKSKITPNEIAEEDYFSSLKILAKIADYIVINVSSPNTPGLRELQSNEKLTRLINKLKEFVNCPPLLIKIAPDLSKEDIDKIGEVCLKESVDGIIAINTSIDRLGLEKRVISQTGRTLSEESGGLSGEPLRDRGVEVIRRLKQVVGSKITLIGVGGISNAQSGWERIAAGASLIQLYTGWIYQGPTLVPNMLIGFLNQMNKHGFKSIKEIVGSEAPWIR